MKHIGTKLFLGFISMTALTIGILWIIQAGFMSNTYTNERISSVNQQVRQAALAETPDYALLAEQINAGLIVLDPDGNLVESTQGLPMIGQMLRTAQSMAPDEANGSVRYVDAKSGTNRYVILGRQTSSGSYIFAVFSLADLEEASRIMRQQLWIITLVLLISSLLLAILLSGRLSRPIRAVTGAARKLAAGQVDVQLPVKTRDEIGQLTEALNDLSVELGRNEKLRQELIANVSHELRSPLTVIQGYAETVRDVTWPSEAKRSEQLNIIIGESSRLTRVVQDILDYSRMQAGVEKRHLSEFPLCPVFEQLARQYELASTQHHVLIQTNCPDQTVIFDRDRLDQVLNNLMNNAINHASPDTIIEVSAVRQEQISRIEVKSIGQPIPPEALSKIWDRYYRADRNRPDQPLGTGLGLAIAKSIFDHHDVRYGVSSENEQTTFWFETCPAVL